MKKPIFKDDAAQVIADSIPEPMLLIGADGTVLTANDRFAISFEFDLAAGPQQLADIFSDSKEYLYEAVRDWLGTGEPLPKKFHRQNPDNSSSSFHVEGWRSIYAESPVAILRVLEENPSFDRFVELTTLADNLNRECTARARIESELRELLGQMNATNNMRDLIIAQMSHDLRTPLNAIMGMSEFILAESFGPVEERYRDYIGDIRYSGKVLLELVNTVLAMTDDTDFHDRAKDLIVDLSECLDSCRRVIAPIAERRGISLLVPINFRAPRIRAEKTLVKQILMNLIGNATKHINEGGRVEVDVDWREGSDLNVCVIDNGPGIDPEKLEKLLNFNPRNAYAIDGTGFGMGLYLTKHSAEAIGGQIKIESTPGEGTTAKMTFPSNMLDHSSL